MSANTIAPLPSDQAAWWRRACTKAIGWGGKQPLLLAAVIMVISEVPFVLVIGAPPQYDVRFYHSVAIDLANGVVPYRDQVLGYPPYAIPLFLLPSFAGEKYSLLFELLVLLADATVRYFLLVVGLREAKGIRVLLPITVYCVALPFMTSFFLQRYDVFPALITLLGLFFFSSNRHVISGLTLAFGSGIKLYPILFVPPLFTSAWHQKKSKQFLCGLILGGLPILLSSFWLPWWRFFEFQGERGLQVESLYASVLWLMYHLGLTKPEWTGANGCMELHGLAADIVLPWAKVWFAVAVGSSVTVASLAATTSKDRSLPALAELSIVPLLAFVIFNQVFSPQFMIWLLPLAAIASLKANPWCMATISVAAMLTPVFYNNDYLSGIQVVATVALVVRNILLISAWSFLMHKLIRSILNHRKQPS